MDRLERAGIILSLIENLKAKGSWCGETHIQKAVYLLQEVMEVNMGFDFILYKHGAYSFDLSDELKSMQVDGFLSLEPAFPYGPVLTQGRIAPLLLKDFKGFIKRFKRKIEFLANNLGNMGVVELEKLSTAVFITKETDETDVDSRASRIHQEKPHIVLGEARTAVNDVDKLIKNAKKI